MLEIIVLVSFWSQYNKLSFQLSLYVYVYNLINYAIHTHRKEYKLNKAKQLQEF